MTKNYAIAIGISEYEFLKPLDYATNDAWLVQKLFREELGFERVFIFTDKNGQETIPTRGNIIKFLADLSTQQFVEANDNFWFFFRGRGINHNGYDYLMPVDGKLTDIENTTISIYEIIKHFQNCSVGNLVFLLDIFDEERKIQYSLQDFINTKLHDNNIITFFSHSYSQLSYDIPVLKHGAFAYALTEALGDRGQCSTVDKLEKYLQYRVSQLVQQYHKAEQIPYVIAPELNRVIISKHASQQDINHLKNSALPAELQGKLEISKKFWIQVLTIDATDTDAINGLEHIYINPLYSTSNFKQSSYYSSLVNSHTQNNFNISIRENSTIAIANTTDQQSKNQIIKHSAQNKYSNFISNKKAPSDIHIEQFINYQQLHNFLINQNWREADKTTSKLLLEISGREKQGWLNIAAINKLNPTILQIIDKIWRKHSNNRFGFSVQKQIWESLGGNQNADYQLWCEYCDRIGWQVNDNWCFYSNLKFDITAPKGHFPAVGIINIITPWQGWNVGVFGCVTGFNALIYQLNLECPNLELSPENDLGIRS